MIESTIVLTPLHYAYPVSYTHLDVYKRQLRKMPENRKKSWSSSQAAELRLYTSTHRRFPVFRISGVKSKSEGVNESSP